MLFSLFCQPHLHFATSVHLCGKEESVIAVFLQARENTCRRTLQDSSLRWFLKRTSLRCISPAAHGYPIGELWKEKVIRGFQQIALRKS